MGDHTKTLIMMNLRKNWKKLFGLNYLKITQLMTVRQFFITQ